MDNPVTPFGLKDPKNIQLANDLAKYRDAIIGQYGESKAAAASAAAVARQKAEEDLLQQFSAIPEDVRNGGYPAIDHDFKAARKRIEYQHQLSLIDPNDAAADTRIKILKEKFPEGGMKDFVDTPQYRDAIHENTSNKERYTMAQNLRDQLLEMRKALDAGDFALAANIGKTGIMKSINSLQGKDAVSSGEQSTRYQDLLSLPDILIQSGDQSVAKTIFSRLAMAVQKNDRKEFESATAKWNELYAKSIEADPENFYRTAARLHSAAADTIDDNVKRIIGMSSPYHAKLMQANFANRLPEFQPQSTQASPSQFAQTAPVTTTVGQGGKTTVISSGSAQTAPAQPQKPQQAPASGGASPETLEAIRAEMKRRGLIN